MSKPVELLRSLKPNSTSKLIAWILTLKPILQYIFDAISAVSNLDFAISAKGNPRMVAVWNFFTSPLGNLCFSALGFAWLTYFAWRQSNRILRDESSSAAPTSQLPELLDSESIKEQNVSRMVSEEDQLVKGCSNAHLEEIDQYQRKGVGKYVLVEKCEINSSPLLEGKLYIEFTFHVTNYSMYYVSIPLTLEALIEGSIRFKGDLLSGSAKLVQNQIKELEPYRTNYFTIRQWISQPEAADISETQKTAGNLFDFSKAVVPIKGGKQFPNVETDKLDLTRGMQNAGLENRIVQLEALQGQHALEIGGWRKYSDTIYRLSIVYGMALQASHTIEFPGNTPLPTDVLKYLDGHINSTIHQCFGAAARDSYYEHVPTIPDGDKGQEYWIRSHCSRLEALIEQQHRQRLAAYTATKEKL